MNKEKAFQILDINEKKINKIEKQIAEKFQDESDAFLLEKSKQTLRTKLQKLNATYDISPFSTKKINFAQVF